MDKIPIFFKNLKKNYNNFQALKGLNGPVPAGITGFIGPNGAGKTTTINVLMGLLRPSGGTAFIFGQDILKMGYRSRKNIGFLPERNALLLDQRAFSFITYLGRIHGLNSRELDARTKKVLEIVGIQQKWWNKKILSFSAGMRQRLGLARAILNPRNRLVILDEPTTNLDPVGRGDLLEIIRKLQKEEGISFFISSHVLSELEEICDHVIIINKGNFVVSGSIKELRKRPKESIFRIMTSNNELFLKELKEIGDLKVEILQVGDIIRIQTDQVAKLKKILPELLSRAKIILDEFEEEVLNLQKIFKLSIAEESEVTK